MKRTTIALLIGVFFASTRVAYSFGDKTLEWAKKVSSLEALVQAKDPDGMRKLSKTCLSAKAKGRVRRLACRLVSEHGSLEAWKAVNPQFDETSSHWAYTKMTDMVVRLRAQQSSTETIGKKLRSFFETVEKDLPEGSAAARRMQKRHRRLAARELVALADSGIIPEDSLPPSLRNHRDLARRKLRRSLSKVRRTKSRLKLLEKRLKRQNPEERRAAAQLLAERGEEALPRVLALLDENTPTNEPPPFTQETRTFSSCLQVLAAVGGEQAAAKLRLLSKHKSKFISTNATFYLQFIDAGVKFPIKHERLFLESYYED